MENVQFEFVDIKKEPTEEAEITEEPDTLNVKSEPEEVIEENTEEEDEEELRDSFNDRMELLCPGIEIKEVENFDHLGMPSTSNGEEMNQYQEDEVFGIKQEAGRKLKHSEEKRFNCVQCNYRSNSKHDWIRHLRSVKHTGGKLLTCDDTGQVLFSCKYCDYKCEEDEQFLLHSQLHIGEEKPYACDMCSFRCKAKFYLVTHKRTHTGEKPFACMLCNFRCAEKASLKKHMRTHTGEKPFKCDLCDFRCAEKPGLKRHIRIHTGEQPYQCKLCDFKCTRNSSLRRHTQRHTGEKPFECSFCPYQAGQSATLKRHVERKHKEFIFPV